MSDWKNNKDAARADDDNNNSNPEFSHVAGILRILGKRWMLLILKSKSSSSNREATRFAELKRTLTGISGTMLAERLLGMEREGLVTKKIYGAAPPKGGIQADCQRQRA
jgi:DNA-binding HxlR family transcriptional regulator